MAKEYWSTIRVDLQSLRKIGRAQRSIYNSGVVNPSKNTLINAISPLASILGLAFINSSPVGVATAVIAAVTSIGPSEKEVLKTMVRDGYWYLGDMEDFLADNPRYNMIEIKLPFIEYNVRGQRVRLITGKGGVTKVHTNGGWIVL